MRVTYIIFSILLIASLSIVLTSYKNDGCDTEGTILSFTPEKCFGCWGWTIKIGQDTIKTDHLPFTSNIAHVLEFPQDIRIGLGNKTNQQTSDYEFYEVNCIELVADPNCSEIVWYQFIGGKPNMTGVEMDKSVAKKWGFTIHYEFGSCGNTEEDQRIAEECEEKNKVSFSCLASRYGDDWQRKFYAQVEEEK